MSNNLTERLNVRLTTKVKNDFYSKVSEINESPTHLLREIIVAFNEGRLVIKLNKDKESLYGDRTRAK